MDVWYSVTRSGDMRLVPLTLCAGALLTYAGPWSAYAVSARSQTGRLTAILEHAGGLMSVYAHAAALLVEVGEEVKRGQLLGKVGDTGSLRGPFLYFELRKDGKPVDPAPWLRRR